MAVSNVFREAVESKSVRKVRIMMEDSLLLDPTFARYDEMERIASAMDGLYDEHDGRSFRQDKNSWDDDYADELMVQVVRNFSHERLEHLKEVVRYLYPAEENPAHAYSSKQSRDSNKTENNISPKRKRSDYQKQKERDKKEGKFRGIRVGAGAAIGAVIGAAVATVVEAPVAPGALAGAAVVGTIIYFGTGRKE